LATLSKPRLWRPAFGLAVALLTTRAWAVAPDPAAPFLQIPPLIQPLSAVAPPPATPAVAFIDPLPGYGVDSPFGLRRLPWEAHARLHAGVDIAAPLGTPVHALANGVVAASGVKAGYGRFVEVDHPSGLVSFYAHLRAPAADIKSGATLKAGDVVGYVGSTGDSTGPHLHLEVRHDGKPLNPAMFIGKTFASVAHLPLALAARVGHAIRIASVSHLPAKMRRRIGALRLASAEPHRPSAQSTG
jgi:murein DD-endopeptidase MepM/ murein hydrolase activator NlpD